MTTGGDIIWHRAGVIEGPTLEDLSFANVISPGSLAPLHVIVTAALRRSIIKRLAAVLETHCLSRILIEILLHLTCIYLHLPYYDYFYS